jgi:hypothetical protein
MARLKGILPSDVSRLDEARVNLLLLGFTVAVAIMNAALHLRGCAGGPNDWYTTGSHDGECQVG